MAMERRMLCVDERRGMFKRRRPTTGNPELRGKRIPSRPIVPLLVTALVIVFLGYRIAIGQETLDSFKFSRDAQQGKLVTPVPLNLKDKNPDLVYLGSYLVNVQGGCNSCHTCPTYKGPDPYVTGSAAPINATNYLAGGTPFPGRGVPFRGPTLTAPNLTPDSSGLPGGLTYDDFKDGMQSGHVSSKPGHVLKVMPWPQFRNLYENDLAAIYQYLSAIPPAQPGNCTGNDQSGN